MALDTHAIWGLVYAGVINGFGAEHLHLVKSDNGPSIWCVGFGRRRCQAAKWRLLANQLATKRDFYSGVVFVDVNMLIGIVIVRVRVGRWPKH